MMLAFFPLPAVTKVGGPQFRPSLFYLPKNDPPPEILACILEESLVSAKRATLHSDIMLLDSFEQKDHTILSSS